VGHRHLVKRIESLAFGAARWRGSDRRQIWPRWRRNDDLTGHIAAALSVVRTLHPDWSTDIDTTTVAPTTRFHGGEGRSLFIVTRDGIAFEFPFGTADHVADALGKPVH